MSISKSFVDNVNALHSGRQAFIKAESDDALKKALKSRVHLRGDNIKEGDYIYYKKDCKGKSKIFRGPSKVVAVNGKKLFIDEGAHLSTVNRDVAVRVDEEFWTINDLNKGDKTIQDISFSNEVPENDTNNKENHHVDDANTNLNEENAELQLDNFQQKE